MSLSEDQVRALLARVVDPNTGEDLVASGQVRGIGIDADKVAVELVLGYPAAGWHDEFANLVEAALTADPAIAGASVSVSSRVVAHEVRAALSPLPRVKNIIAVASGKGGVGKSTTATNLALALAAEGATVGILDADIYGPSQPMMMGVSGRPTSPDGKSMEPLHNYGVQVNSIGFMVEPDQAMIWRGPMATQALEQLMRQTNWRDVDYLVVDMPPGTGDIQLTLTQRVPVTGAVIVTTPQDIALADARKAVTMFEKVGVPILGLVENMAMHVCSNCGHVEYIFGADGGRKYAEEKGVTYLGALPLAIGLGQGAELHRPLGVTIVGGLIASQFFTLLTTPAVYVLLDGLRGRRRPRATSHAVPSTV